MKIFPHILSRVGGIPINDINVFSFGKYKLVDRLLQQDVELIKHRAKISNEFHSAIENIKSPYLKSNLINAFRDFKKGRASYVKAILNIEAHEVLDLVQLSTEYDRLLFRKNKNLQAFYKNYEESISDSFLELQRLSENESFLKGILQSSQSFYQRVLSFQYTDVHGFKKKEKQTARSLVQYIYRTATKTSPFSHFTTIDLMSFKREKFDKKYVSNLSNESKSFLQFNNFLISEIQDLFLEDPIILRKVEIDLNPSIREDYEDFYFIKNEKNIETFQRLELSEALVMVQNELYDGPILFGDLMDIVQKTIDGTKEEVRDFLFQLIEIGFLEWKWKINSTHTNWDDLYYAYLNSFPEFDENIKWVSFLYYLTDIKSFYKRNEASHRLPAQNQMKEELNDFGISDTRPEIILFEDVLTPRGFSIKEEEVNLIVKTLDRLLYFVEPLMEDEMKNKIRYFWEKKFTATDSIPLVRFYELFFQEDFEEMKIEDEHKSYLEKKWRDAITKTGQMSIDGVLNFSLKDIEKMIGFRPFPPTNYSGLFQFFDDGTGKKAVINGLSQGRGKLFGRFLHMFPEKITKELQEWNKDVNDSCLLVENIDASSYNVNTHPPLVSREIKMHNSQNKYEEENQIPVSEIEVKLGNDGLPFLFFPKTQQHIYIVDLGFENPAARSPMFQLLNGFSENNGTYRIFVKMVNEVFAQENEEGIRFYPRIVIDEHLILQRQSQVMDVSFFPKINKNNHAAEFFYKMQQFKNLHNLPQYIFVQPIRDFSNPENILKQDFYKPQCIDLHAPISVELLKSILQKHQGQIKVEEMLPMGMDLDADYAREDVVQWKRF